jgi:hypothetical protein
MRKKRPLPESQLWPERPSPSAEELEKFNSRVTASREDAKRRLETGQPVVWREPRKTTPKQRAENRKAVKRGEESVDKILSGHTRRGRKTEAVYDRSDYLRKMAQICGREEPTAASLARYLLSYDKSLFKQKRHKMQEAHQRRKKP